MLAQCCQMTTSNAQRVLVPHLYQILVSKNELTYSSVMYANDKKNEVYHSIFNKILYNQISNDLELFL